MSYFYNFICLYLAAFVSIIYLLKLSKIFNFLNIEYIFLFTSSAVIFYSFVNLKKYFFFFIYIVKKLNNFSYNKISLLSLIITILYCTSSLILNKFDISSIFYEKRNFFLIYIVLKIIFTFCIIISILNVGFFIVSYFANNKYKYSTKIITYSLIGLITISIFGTFLGLVGFLNYNLIFIIFLIGTLFSRKLINELTELSKIDLKNKIKFNIYFSILLASLAIIFIRSSLPFAEDGDVWGHYLNYYSIVQDKGDIFDASYWPHFNYFKGQGLNFLIIILSDKFASSQVSLIFLLIFFLIIYDIGNDFIKSKFVLGVVILAVCSYGISVDNDVNKISFAKQHISFACLYSYIFWCIYKFIFIKIKSNKIFYVLFLITVFFTGFSNQIFSFVIFNNLLLVTIVLFFFSKKHFKPILNGTVFLGLGVFLSLLTNYIKTGLPEFVLTNVFWQFSNQEKFLDLIGYKNFLFTLLSTSDHLAIEKQNIYNLSKLIFDINNLTFAYVLSIFRSYYVFFLYLAIIIFNIYRNRKYILYLNLIILLSLLVILLIWFFFNNPAFQRSLFFIKHFFIFLFLINISSFLNLSSLRFNKIFEVIFIIPVLFFFAFFVEKNFRKNLEYYKSFYNGNSIEDILLKCDSTQHFQVDCQNFKFITALNKKYNYKNLYALNASGGTVATLPRPGLIIEPYFNKSKKLNNFLYKDSDEIFKEFELLNINYFLFNSKTQFFGNFLTTEFANKYLKVVEVSKDEIYFLKLQKTNTKSDIDIYFQNIYNLKRSYLINYIFSNKFKNKVYNLGKKEIIKEITILTSCVNETNKKILLKVLSDNKLEDNLSSDEILVKIKYSILLEISKFYDLEKNNESLSTIGSMIIEPNYMNKFYINRNKINLCKFYDDDEVFIKLIKIVDSKN